MSFRLHMSAIRNLTAFCAIFVLSGCPLLSIPGVGGSSGANVNFSLTSSTKSLEFGSSTNELTLTVRKSFSSRPMSPLKATTPQPWITTVLPANPVSSGPDDAITVTVIVDRTLMNPGLNTGFVTLSSSGTVPVVVQVTAFQSLVANFVAIPAIGAVGQTIQFTDLSDVLAGTGPILSWLWDFGDGTTSTLQNPVHAYQSTGLFNVSLTVATANATSTAFEANFVNIIPPVGPTASFEVTPVSRMAVPGESLTFVDTSSLGTSAVGTYAWDFGDGSTSTDPVTSHAYAATGTYQVTLTVTTVAGASSANVTVTIVDSVPPQVSFSRDKSQVIQNELVAFTNNTVAGTLPIVTSTWDFGDGNTSTANNPTHSYANVGTFNVTLTVTTLTETVVSAPVAVQVLARTALDDYLDNGDTSFAWNTNGGQTLGGLATVSHLQMTSQQWRTAADVYRIGNNSGARFFQGATPVTWEHNISIYEPTVIKKGGVPTDSAILFVDGGSNGNGPSAETGLAFLAFQTGLPVVQLDQVPNQPIYFVDDINNSRTEDEIIAYTFDKFLLDPNDDDWPLLLPMVKSAVRGMDASQQYLSSQGKTINNFLITGASKRGWTTWLTASGLRDGRVKGIAPMVIDFLNSEPSLLRHLQSYNGFSPAVEDYVFEGIFDRFGTPQADLLRDIIDPLSYNQRLTMPKMVIHGTRDEFFMPDSTEFYFSQLLPDKWVLPVQNAGHNLSIQGVGNAPVFAALGAFFASVAGDDPIPTLEFTYSGDKSSVTVVPDPAGGTVSEVLLWQAYDATPTLRDFRQSINGDPPTPTWVQSTLTAQPNGSYIGTVDIPVTGWRAYFVQVTFSTGHQFGSEVRIVPNTVPFPGRTYGDGGNDFTP